MAFYSLSRLLLAKLARLHHTHLTQFTTQNHQSLLAISMTAARLFSHIHGNSKQLANTLTGDIFQVTAALARCGIEAATSGSLANYVDTFLGEANEADSSPSRATTAALLSVCLQKEPLSVLRTLLQRLQPGCVITIVTALETYFNMVPETAIPDLVKTELGNAFSRIIHMNNQVTHRVRDSLVAIARVLRRMVRILSVMRMILMDSFISSVTSTLY